MNQFHEQFKREAETVRMTAAERHALRERIVAHMEYHPMPVQPTVPWRERVTGAVYTLTHNFYMRRAAGAFAIVLLMFVPFVAERAVPGDVLYPVKVKFNEGVKSTLTRSPYEQVAWETERLERRLAEARILEREGKLTPEMEAQVAEAVKQHSDAVQQSIASIRESDQDAAAIAEITLSSALDVQSEMLEGGSAALGAAVNSAREAAAASQQTSKPSYEKLLARIERESTTAYELFNTVTDQASETERKDIEQRLESIRQDVATATKRYETDPDAAVTILVTALADVRKVISFMTDIDVRTHVTIDELLPDELTDDERRAAITTRIEETNVYVTAITERLSTVDANTRAAVEARLAELDTSLAAASSSLAADVLDAADEESAAAYAIAQEIVAVLDEYDAMVGEHATTTGSTTSTTAPAASTTTDNEMRSTSTANGAASSSTTS